MFKKQQKVMFQHCDPAGIVFYPRYFEMINALVEDWFDEALGYSFKHMHMDLGTGIPTVNTNVTFRNPSRLGDELTLILAVEKIGRSSVTCQVQALGEKPNSNTQSEIRFEGEVTLVYMDLNTGKSQSFPTELKQSLGLYKTETIAVGDK
ncbi:MAG: thioesterase family protein [Alphaproteobacteria bacterium]|nr:thioesterase family protein [Alphaproteobacteria bacterium]